MKLDTIKVFPPNTKAKAGDKEGMISAVRIKAKGYITYKFIWWEAGVRHSEWVEESEITLIDFDHSAAVERTEKIVVL